MQSTKMTPSSAPGVLGAFAQALRSFGYYEIKVSTAFGGVVLDCVKTAIFKVAGGEQVDKAKMSRQSSGILGSF